MNKKSTLKKVLKRIKKYGWLVALSLIMAVATVLLTLYLPILTGEAVDGIIAKGLVNFTGLLKILKKMVIVLGATALFQWFMNIINNHITYHVVKDIRKEAFEKLEKLPLKYVDSRSYGDIVSRMISDVDQFAEGLLMGFTQLFTGVLTIVGTLFFMFDINIKIALVVVILTPLSLFVAGFIAKRTYTMFQKQSETRGEQTSLIEEMVENLKVVKAFGHEDENQETFDEINGRLQKYSLSAIFFSSLVNPCTRFINSMIYAGVGICGAIAALNGRLSVGQLTCFLSYANQYTKPFNEISGVITELQNALACAARVFELIEEEAEIPDRESAVVLDEQKARLS
jgi:ATP-binding cassette subfamily B protein